MNPTGWRTSLVAQGFRLSTGHAVPVAVGLVDTAAGGVLLALRVGESGELVILPSQAGTQLVVNVWEALAERFAVTGEWLGGGMR